MPNYSIVVEVLETRAYQIVARSVEEAAEAVRQDFDLMPYDKLEESIETLEVEDAS